jgi:hypothetical protein
MVLEPILEEPEDEYVDLFDLPEGEEAPPRRTGRRSLSAPSRVRFENDAAAERREHVIIPSVRKKKETENTEKHKSTKRGEWGGKQAS